MNWGKFLFSFEGRISRKAFWLFILASIVVQFLLMLAAPWPQITEATLQDPEALNRALMEWSAATPLWTTPVNLLLTYISLAVYAKRWHDQDRSAWWNLLILGVVICCIGPLVMLIMCGFIPGTPGPNKYGQAPMA